MAKDGRVGNEDDFGELLQSLYASATDAGRTTEFLTRLAAATSSHTSALQVHDASHSSGQMLISVGAIAMGSDELRRYNETYAGENVWMKRGTAVLVANGVTSGAELIAPRDMLKTRFHQDFLRQLEIHDSFGLLLWHGGGSDVAVMTVNRSRQQGLFGDGERRLLTRLLPHLQNAYAIQRRLSWADQERIGLLAALDRLRFGVMLFDAAGRLRVANDMAGRLLGGRIDVGQRLGELPGLALPDRNELCAAIDLAARPPLAVRRRILLRTGSGAPELVAIVLPMPGSGFADAGVSSARVAVFLHPLRRPLDSDDRESLLVELYGLSPVQARLARLLCTGVDLPQCAELLGNRMHTIKSQLKAIFRKTGTHRQGELVALIGDLLRD